MAVVTAKSLIKIFDISRRTYKQIGVTRKFEIKSGEMIGEIKDIALNQDGKKLAILADQCPYSSIRIPDTKFYIYDIDMDKFIEQKVNKNRIPVEIFWDLQDPRLLAVETEFSKQSENGTDLNDPTDATQKQVPLSQLKDTEIEEDFKKKNVEEFSGKTLETFFVTTDYGCKRQDVVKFEQGEETLLGLSVPYLYYMGFKVENEEEEE